MPDFRRLPTRLRDYDYHDPGSYFVTICLADRTDRFGEIDEEGVVLQSAGGDLILTAWMQIPYQFDDAALNTVIVMPDHLHGIVFVGVDPASSRRSSLNDVIGWFKTVTTTRYADGVRRTGLPPFNRHLWQRSYHDRIIRNDADLEACRNYIEENPYR